MKEDEKVETENAKKLKKLIEFSGEDPETQKTFIDELNAKRKGEKGEDAVVKIDEQSNLEKTLIDKLKEQGKGEKGEAAVTRREEIRKQIKELSEKEEVERESHRVAGNKESSKIEEWDVMKPSKVLDKITIKNTDNLGQLSNVINNTGSVIGSVINVLKNNLVGNAKYDSSNKNPESPKQTKGGKEI
jgi:hypothetical protein